MKFNLTLSKQKKKNNSVLSSPVRPHTDWRRLIICFLSLCVVVVAWSFYLYWTSEYTLSIDPFRSNTPNPEEKASLQRVNEFFSERESSRNSTTSPVIDPSL